MRVGGTLRVHARGGAGTGAVTPRPIAKPAVLAHRLGRRLGCLFRLSSAFVPAPAGVSGASGLCHRDADKVSYVPSRRSRAGSRPRRSAELRSWGEGKGRRPRYSTSHNTEDNAKNLAAGQWGFAHRRRSECEVPTKALLSKQSLEVRPAVGARASSRGPDARDERATRRGGRGADHSRGG